jgi:hypothetical protein
VFIFYCCSVTQIFGFFSCSNRLDLPNQTLSLRSLSHSLSSQQDSTPLDTASPKEDVDAVNKRKNRKLKDNHDEEGKENYYCKYCNVTWPIHHFKNRQQFGAHCSNCSRKRKFKSTCLCLFLFLFLPTTPSDHARRGLKIPHRHFLHFILFDITHFHFVECISFSFTSAFPAIFRLFNVHSQTERLLIFHLILKMKVSF